MFRNMPYRDKSCVAKMYRNQIKGGPSEIFHKRNLILGSITDSLVSNAALGILISAINVKDSALRRINNGKAKEKMAQKR